MSSITVLLDVSYKFEYTETKLCIYLTREGAHFRVCSFGTGSDVATSFGFSVESNQNKS